MVEEPILDLDDIQGGIIPGFKKDSQHFLFFRIVDPVRARAWLKSLTPRLTDAREVMEAHNLWRGMRLKLRRDPDNLDFMFLNCAFSASGLKKLGVANIEVFDDQAFELGLEERAGVIGDPPRGSGKAGAPELWRFGSGRRRPHVLIILATDDFAWAVKTEKELVASARREGLQRIHVDRGRVRPGNMAGHEHFGFKDGISQPAIRGRKSSAPNDFLEPRMWPPDPEFDIYRARFAVPGRPLVWPGHFLFGYSRQKGDEPETPSPNWEALGPDWAKNGSFLVYRRLSQDVPRFHAFLAEATEFLRRAGFDPNLTPERLGALLLGRWASGWPVMRDPGIDHGDQKVGTNHFTFSEATAVRLPDDPYPLNPPDQDGLVCPFAAHIRKVQPRDDSTDIGPMERTFQKLILRRGITFGPEMDRPNAERGLIFVSFQTSIIDQFEFIMGWMNDVGRPHDSGGVDPISTASNKTVRLMKGTEPYDLPIPDSLVVATGGEYMFAPSLRFFSKVL